MILARNCFVSDHTSRLLRDTYQRSAIQIWISSWSKKNSHSEALYTRRGRWLHESKESNVPVIFWFDLQNYFLESSYLITWRRVRCPLLTVTLTLASLCFDILSKVMSYDEVTSHRKMAKDLLMNHRGIVLEVFASTCYQWIEFYIFMFVPLKTILKYSEAGDM